MPLRLTSNVELAGANLELTGTVGSTGRPPRILMTDDELFYYAADMNGGAGTPTRLTTNGVDRWALGTGDSVIFTVRMPAWWAGFTVNMLWTKEAAGSGNVSFQLSYRRTTFADSNLFTAKTTTTVATQAVPSAVGDRGYTAGLGGTVSTPPGVLVGDPNIVHIEIARSATGNTYTAGDVSIAVVGVIRQGKWT